MFYHRSVFQVVKTLDEEKSKFTSIALLFNEDITTKRKSLVSSIVNILFEDFEVIGRKSRDLLWRKVYYDPISIAKKLCKQSSFNSKEEFFLLINFIKEAIKHYKTLILKFEDLFSLDLRFIIDFGIIANGADAFEKRSEKEIYTVNEMNHASETIHAFLVCLGDLHRYCIEFNFAEKDVSINTSKELASKYYVEAFKLNPKIGMPHNQLGTLCAGQNYEVDSIFHYLYALCSPLPFELSEANVNRVFQQNIEALEQMEPVGDGFNVKDFIMQMILVIDIFFYDKEIGEFNTLCRTVLVSFKEYLKTIKIRRDRHQVDLTFQLTSILMLCLLKLKLKNSPKVHSLNAFLVAFCAEIIEVAIRKVDSFISDHKEENLKFANVYNKRFIDFDKKIKNARELNRGSSKEKPIIKIMKSASGEQNGSINNSQKDGHSSNQLSIESKPTSDEASGKSDPAPIIIAKKPLPIQQPPSHNRRNRRRRCKASGSVSSDDESETESLASESDDNVSMNSDFDSYDEQDDEFSDRSSSDEGENHSERQAHEVRDSDNDDLVIENEEIVYANGTEKITNGGNDAYDFKESAHETSSDDFVIEQEQFLYPEDELLEEASMKLKYKKKYMKDDPNLIIKFNESNVSCMKSLKLLFDWLRLNQDILIGCYRSNPEFITNIMKLINFLNIDIFTRKIYFDRSLLTTKNVRENLRYLFDIRQQIPTEEDIVFKKCVMFEELQRPLDWELNYKLQITQEEDVILRNFKIIDFGFSLCKLKKFSYSFCARSRMFIEKTRRRRVRERRRGSAERGNGKKNSRRRDRRRNRGRKKMDSNCENFERMTIKKHHEEKEIEEYPSIQQSHQLNFRKGYLKCKMSEKIDKENEALNIKEDNVKQIDIKNELMGKLWLKSEIQSLESKKHSSVALTPYIMLDSNCLTDYLYIVKNLVKSKKFVVLIPNAGKLNVYLFLESISNRAHFQSYLI